MKTEQLLVIKPDNSLKFEGTFQEIISEKLTLENPTDMNIAFKIKTTMPKQYCVRPSVGYVPPEQSKEVTIMLQPLHYTLADKAKHKFMIQSKIITDEEASCIDTVWKEAKPEEIMCTKLLSVLVQTKPEIKEISSTNLSDETKMDSPLSNESNMITESVEEPVTESGDMVDVTSISVTNKFEDYAEENQKLREQVSILKKMIFDNTYKMESIQSSLSAVSTTETVNDENLEKISVSADKIGLPVIVYQLIAFFLGLIIGKFFL